MLITYYPRKEIFSFSTCLWRITACLVFLFPFPILSAQMAHEHLITSETLAFADIFVSALEHSPEYMETPVREDQAESYSATGNSWIAGRPSLQMNYYDDSRLDNVGLSEFEYGVQLPLWRPGQRRDTRALGEGYVSQVEQWKQLLSWLIAGRVRSVLAALAEAELGIALQNQVVADAMRLRDVTLTLFEAGEVARLELMQAETLLVESQADLLQAEAAMVDAERIYETLTGLDIRPAKAYSEVLTSREEIENSHPQLQYLRSSINLADANVQQSENSAKGNPTITIGTRRERGDRFQNSISSVGIQLSIPFGGGSFVSAQSSSARRAKVDAEVSFQNSFIQLNTALHEVEHDLFIVGEEEPLRRSQMDLSRQRYDMAMTAFGVGETTLAEVVIAQQQAQESDRTLRLLLLEKQRLITEFNQIIGVLP